MSLSARSGAVRAALDQRGYPYVAERGDSPHTFLFGRCPWCNGPAGSQLGLFADGSLEFRCEDCDCTSAADILKLIDVDFNRPLRKSGNPRPHSRICGEFAVDKQVLVDGLFRYGLVGNVNSSSKGKKSRFIMQLAYELVRGGMFLGLFKCHKPAGKVLIADYELPGDEIRRRCEAMADKLKIPHDVRDNVEYLAMREDGRMNLFELCNWLESLPPATYSVVVIDALYKATPDGFDENDNADMAKLYDRIDELMRQHGCAVIIVHHFSKGNQSDKAVTDMGAGAGSQSRAADFHLVMVNHAADEHIVLRGVCRGFPNLQDVVLRYDHPLWVHAEGVDPNDTGDQDHRHWAEVASLLTAEPTRKDYFLESAQKRLRIKSAAATKRLLEQAIDKQHVTQEGGKGKVPYTVYVTPDQLANINERLNKLFPKEGAA